MLRRVFVLVLVVLVAAGVVGTGIVGAKAPKEVLNVSYNPMPLNVPSIVAKCKGLLEKELEPLGVKVSYKSFLAGYQMTEAMAAGELDIAPVMGGTSTITSAAGGRDIRIVGAYGSSPAGFGVAVKADSPISTVTQLLGKRIALPVGTEVHYLLAKMLEQEGKSLRDVTVVNMLIPDAVNALLAGHVDAAMVVEPVMTKLVSGQKIKVVATGEGLFLGMTVMTATADLAEEHPELIEAFLRAHEASIRYMEANPEEVAQLVAQETKLPLPIVKKIMPKFTFNPQLTDEAVRSLQDTESFLYQNQITKKRVDVEKLIWAK